MKVLLFIVLSLGLCQGCFILNLISNIIADIDSRIQGTSSCNDASKEYPTIKDVLNGGKQVLFGLPFKIASSLVNKICSCALSTGLIKSQVIPKIKRMSFVLITRNGSFSASLNRARCIWEHREFHKNRKTVIFVTGWLTDLDKEMEPIDVVASAYLDRGDSNFVALDPGKFLHTLYTWAALNTQPIGECVAKGLVQLLDYVELKDIHLIGHSLGAHIVGFCGRRFSHYTGKLIPRITGLDPARPCFSKGCSLSGLQRGDADFIDVIHSNPGGLGQREPLGNVDFYPSGFNSIPPGCLSIVCAHHRSWRYYAESVYPGNENNFMGVRCDSLTNLKKGKCLGKAYPMGYAVPQNIKGSFFLDVNCRSPFGKGRRVYQYIADNDDYDRY